MLSFEQLSKYKYIEKFCYNIDFTNWVFHIKLTDDNKIYVKSFLRTADLEPNILIINQYVIYYTVYLYQNPKHRIMIWRFQPVLNKEESFKFGKLGMRQKLEYKYSNHHNFVKEVI